jgi:light-regulated signal transduction histidine kinase (bacteriophytochrome)
MHQVNHIGANRSEWHEPDLRRSIDFHAVLLAMAGHDLRQHLQIILNSYGWLSARATSYPERERIARGQNAVMQMAEQLHQLVTALRIHQKTSGMALVPVGLGSLFSTLGWDATRFAAERGVQLRVIDIVVPVALPEDHMMFAREFCSLLVTLAAPALLLLSTSRIPTVI